MDRNFENLTHEELMQLRNEITLNSLYIADYCNDFGFNSVDIAQFFEGYLDYICEIAKEDGITDLDVIFDAYDTENNLIGYFNCCDDLSWVKFENGFRIGDRVRWNDPAIEDYEDEIELAKARVFEVADINDEFVLIVEVSGGTESEVYPEELEKIN